MRPAKAAGTEVPGVVGGPASAGPLRVRGQACAPDAFRANMLDMSGMNSEKLSARKKQPGHDQTFKKSESMFFEAATKCLDPDKYEVVPQPKDLLDLFPGRTEEERALGIKLEALIIHRESGRRLYVEVKKQGKGGNADERAAKHHTVQFYKTMQDRFGFDYHPIVTVFCESLASLPRYTRKSPYFFEEKHIFNWVDYDLDMLCAYLNEPLPTLQLLRDSGRSGEQVERGPSAGGREEVAEDRDESSLRADVLDHPTPPFPATY